MGAVYNPKDESWKTVERRDAEAVTSHVLLPLEAGGKTRLALTRVEAGGAFGPHVDDYGHIFCVLEGRGEVMIGKERHPVAQGDVIITEVEEPHGLFAAADESLVLVAANVYP
jgi:quercetin dioxygenase-like cupin family protein